MKQTTAKNLKTELARLQKENRSLKSELRKLQNSQTRYQTQRTFNWRVFWKWVSFSLATVVFITASVIFYIGMTLTNTDRFMKVAGPLATQPAVQDAVVQKTTDALFQQVDLIELALSILPPRVDFLAPTIASQIQNTTKTKASGIVASDQFQQQWNTTVRDAHEKLITGLKNYRGDGTIDLNDLFGALTKRLEDGKLGFLAGKQLPPRAGNIVIIESQWLPKAHTFVTDFPVFRMLAFALFFILIAITLWLSDRRRRTTIQLGVMLSAASIILLIALRIVRRFTLQNADPAYHQAATEIWSVLTRPFAIQLITTVVLGLAIATVAWLGSQSAAAVTMRAKINGLFAGRLHETVFDRENSLTLWVGKRERLLLTTVGVLFVASFLFIELTLGSLLLSILISGLAALAVVTVSGQKTETV